MRYVKSIKSLSDIWRQIKGKDVQWTSAMTRPKWNVDPLASGRSCECSDSAKHGVMSPGGTRLSPTEAERKTVAYCAKRPE